MTACGFCAPYLPHRHMPLLVSEQVDVNVGADVGWPLEVDVVLPETFHGVERPRLTITIQAHVISAFRFAVKTGQGSGIVRHISALEQSVRTMHSNSRQQAAVASIACHKLH